MIVVERGWTQSEAPSCAFIVLNFLVQTTRDRTWRSGLCKPPVQLLAKLSGAELRRVFLSLLMLVLLLGSYSTIAISSNNHSIINLLQYTQFFQDRGLPR